MRKLLTLLVVLFLTAPAWAQRPAPPAEVRLATGEIVVIRAGVPAEWVALDAGLYVLPPGTLKDADAAAVSSARPGRYRLLALAGRDGTVCVVVVGGDPGPQPPPPPPPPPPQPVAGPLWILIVEETADAWPNRGAFAADAALRDRIKSKSHHWRVADKDVKDPKGQLPADLKPWLEVAKVKGLALPALFLVTEKGQIMYEGALPKTPAELIKLLEAKGG